MPSKLIEHLAAGVYGVVSHDKRQDAGGSKKELVDLARRKGITGWHGMRKQELVAALAHLPAAGLVNKGPRKIRKKPTRSRPQLAAARNTNGTASGEEQVERSKYDVGVPTKDLSVKVPKDLPGGYGKDRIVCMVVVTLTGCTPTGN